MGRATWGVIGLAVGPAIALGIVRGQVEEPPAAISPGLTSGTRGIECPSSSILRLYRDRLMCGSCLPRRYHPAGGISNSPQ